MSKPEKILIVEDEAIVAMDLAAKLDRLGYEVAGTTGLGEEAITLAMDLQPDVVLMDMRLGGEMDGITAAQQIRHVCNAAIIYLTAHSEPAMVIRAEATAPVGYISKPFEAGDLESALKMASGKHGVSQAQGSHA
jgi:DNA-binding NarL/FixJ family response regulator